MTSQKIFEIIRFKKAAIHSIVLIHNLLPFNTTIADDGRYNSVISGKIHSSTSIILFTLLLNKDRQAVFGNNCNAIKLTCKIQLEMEPLTI